MVHLMRLALGLLFLATICLVGFGASKFPYTGFVICGVVVAVFSYSIGVVIQDLLKLRKPKDGRFNL